MHSQTTPIEPVVVRFDWTTNLISCASLSCYCRVVYFFTLQFSLVMSCEFSTMFLASGGFAPRPPPGLRPWNPLGTSVGVPQTPVPHTLYENPGSATGPLLLQIPLPTEWSTDSERSFLNGVIVWYSFKKIGSKVSEKVGWEKRKRRSLNYNVASL